MNVPRGNETTYHTQFNIYTESNVARISQENINEIRLEVTEQLSTWKDVNAYYRFFKVIS